MNTLKTLYYDGKIRVGLDSQQLWLYLDERKWGFLHAGGIYCHRKRLESFKREFGFHVPKPLLAYKITWEVPMPKCIATWTYDPKNKQRFLTTDPLVFVSLSRMTYIAPANHVPRPRSR